MIEDYTAVRKELKRRLVIEPAWRVVVTVGRHEDNDDFDGTFLVRIACGTESDAVLEAVDKLLAPSGVPAMLGDDEGSKITTHVKRSSGHMMMPGPGGSGLPWIGAEWTVKVMV